MVKLKRIYETPEESDGTRYLVEKFWPRGVKKESLSMDGWLKEVAPSDPLRKWFGHDPVKWEEFKERYFTELRENRKVLQPLLDAARRGNVTLLYSAHDTLHNNALALKEFLEENREWLDGKPFNWRCT